jgi:fatty-acyl-CoA synthase
MAWTEAPVIRAQAAPSTSLTLAHLLERADLDLSKTAIVFKGRTRTYRELRIASRKVANALVGLGIEPLDRIALLTRNRLEFTEIESGISAARGIMVALDWRLRAQELADLLNRSAARAIFVDGRSIGTILELRRSGAVPALRTVIGLDGGTSDLSYEEVLASTSDQRPSRPGTPDEAHEIMFTSAASAVSRGVVWSDANVIWNAVQQVIDFKLGPEHSTHMTLDQYDFGGRHNFCWPILHRGGTVHVKPSGGFDAAEVVRYVADHRITHILWVPTMLYEILRVPRLDRYDLGALQMIICGGTPVSASTILRAQEAFPDTDFLHVYGNAEVGGTITFNRRRDATRKPGSVGLPSSHAEVRVVDADGEDVPPGVAGEIAVRGPTVAAGYWEAPEIAAETFVDGWLRTGDVGRLDSEGFMYFSGRTSNAVVSGGMTIFPAEIERALQTHPAVQEAVVLGLPDEKWGETVCAVIHPAEGRAVDEHELIEYCSRRLASYKKPTSVLVVDEIPRDGAGEPMVSALRERALSGRGRSGKPDITAVQPAGGSYPSTSSMTESTAD